MPIIKSTQAATFEIPGLTVQGLASPRRGASETCVWRIALAPGVPGTPHAVTREEVFVATAGTAVAVVAGERHELGPGDALIVPAGADFSLANPSDRPFEALVAFPVGGQAVTPDGTFTPPWAE